jgi:hypothetical protein
VCGWEVTAPEAAHQNRPTFAAPLELAVAICTAPVPVRLARGPGRRERQKSHLSSAPENIKALLQELVQHTSNITQHLPKEEAEYISRDLETFTTEATSNAPRQQWLTLSAEGLRKAATNVAAAGLPVIELLNKIIPLLPGQ